MKKIIFLFLALIHLPSLAAEPKTKAKCDELKNFYKKSGVKYESGKVDPRMKTIFETGKVLLSGSGIIASKPLVLTCSRKIEDSGSDGILLFGMGITLDKKNYPKAISNIENALGLNAIEVGHRQKIKTFLETKTKNLNSESYPDWISESSGPYKVQIMTSTADANGNISLMIQMDYQP